MNTLRIVLCVPEEAQEQVVYLFREVPDVEICPADPLDQELDALLVPVNSFGFLDSGFPLRVSDRFGFQLQEELQRRIASDHFGELLVGQAEILPTGREAPAYVVAAPISRACAEDLKETINVYLATRSALLAICTTSSVSINSVALPLLGVQEGGLSPYAAGRQIRYGVRSVLRDEPRRIQNLSKAKRREKDLKRQARAVQ